MTKNTDKLIKEIRPIYEAMKEDGIDMFKLLKDNEDWNNKYMIVYKKYMIGGDN